MPDTAAFFALLRHLAWTVLNLAMENNDLREEINTLEVELHRVQIRNEALEQEQERVERRYRTILSQIRRLFDLEDEREDLQQRLAEQDRDNGAS